LVGAGVDLGVAGKAWFRGMVSQGSARQAIQARHRSERLRLARQVRFGLSKVARQGPVRTNVSSPATLGKETRERSRNMVRKHPREQRKSRQERRSSRRVRLTPIQKVLLGGGLLTKTPTIEKRPAR
jgi:hypothetical protein